MKKSYPGQGAGGPEIWEKESAPLQYCTVTPQLALNPIQNPRQTLNNWFKQLYESNLAHA